MSCTYRQVIIEWSTIHNRFLVIKYHLAITHNQPCRRYLGKIVQNGIDQIDTNITIFINLSVQSTLRHIKDLASPIDIKLFVFQHLSHSFLYVIFHIHIVLTRFVI